MPKPAKPPKPRTPRDSQRSRVYAFERKYLESHNKVDKLSAARCQRFVEKIWKNEVDKFKPGRKKAPTITAVDRNAKQAYYISSIHEIALPKWAMTKITICHELAHALESINDEIGGDHGPYFVGRLIYLLAKYCPSDDRKRHTREDLEFYAKVRRLKIKTVH